MADLFDLTGKVALVVGVTDVIGHAQALGLAQHGADVIVADSSAEESGQAANEIQSIGRKSLAITVDVTQEQSAADMVKQVLEAFTRIDILVNSFTARIRKPATEFPVEEWQQVMDVNIRGTFICCKVVGREMVKQRSGKIINHSSVRGEYGLPDGYAAYCSSKGAINTLTKTLACEWAKYNVLVNAIAPTFVKSNNPAFVEPDPEFVKMVTARIPMGRFALPEEFVGPTVFLASKASDFVTGQILYVDGGTTTW